MPARKSTLEVRTDISPVTGLEAGRHVHTKLTSFYLEGANLTTIPRFPGREAGLLETLRTIRDFDPDGSNAVQNLLRMSNPGHDIAVVDATGQPSEPGLGYINGDLAKRLFKIGGGGTDTLIDTLFLALYTYGGVGTDCEINATLTDLADAHPFGPQDIEFKYVPIGETNDVVLRMFDARRGILKQDNAALSELQVFYLPMDPDIDDPYGRPMLLPAVAPLLMMMNLINEI